MKSAWPGRLLTVALSVFVAAASARPPLGSAFTYQGQLQQSGSSAEGSFPMVFTLWDAAAAGNQVGPTLTFDGLAGNPAPVEVADGLFTVALDFGAAAFGADARWLEVTVDGVTLSPRQAMTPVPAALFSMAPWASDGGTISYTGGNVGIGTTQPSTALEISRATGSTELGLIGGDGGRRWTLQSSAGVDPDLLGGSFQIIDRTASVARFLIDQDGNIGIGTPYPDRPLTVVGNTGLFGDVLISPNLTVSGQSFLNGSVGVNTFPFNPQSELHVNGTIQISSGALQFGSLNQNSDQLEIRRYDPGLDASVLAINIGDNPGSDIPPGDELIITAGGQVLFLFRSNGAAAKIGAPAWAAISDARAKHDIEPLTGVLDQVLQLKGHSFFYNEPNQPGARAGKCIGFVAQEVEPIFPEWVSTDHDGMKTMHLTGFEALAVEALRDLRAEKDAEIEALRRENDALHERLEAVEKVLQTLIRADAAHQPTDRTP